MNKYTTILIIYLNHNNDQYLLIVGIKVDTSYLVTSTYFVYQKLQAIDLCPCVYFI